MVSLVKAFIFYSLIKQSEFLYCFASPLGGHANQPPPCGQYGFRCTTSHEYEICVESDDGSDIGIPAINHSCPRDMLCDEDNESYCSLPDDGRDSIILVGKPHFGLDCDVSDLKYDNAFELRRRCELQTNERQNDAVNLNIQKNTVANFEGGGNSDDDGGRDRKLMDKVVGNDYESPELCITPPAPFECDMLGYFADHDVKKRFYFCDIRPDGSGFRLHLMQCLDQRIFDPIKRECILPGTTHNI